MAGPALGKLPSVVPSETVIGHVRPVPGAELGLRPGIPVVIGAGDRQCEVLGAGIGGPPDGELGPRPTSRSPCTTAGAGAGGGGGGPRAVGGWLLEGGLSAAGSFLAWLGRLLGGALDELARRAGDSPPGARGVMAVPWLDGARAPWWRDDARAGFVGLGSAHGMDDLCPRRHRSRGLGRPALMEGVTAGRLGGDRAQGVTLGGAGTGLPLWVDVLTSVLGLPAVRHRSGEAASAGAALLAGRALGMGLTLDQLDPVEAVITPDAATVEIYRRMRPQVEQVAASVIAATDALPENGGTTI